MGRTWLITGAGRGIGASAARAALDRGDRVVASARDPEKIPVWAGEDRLLRVRLDVRRREEIEAAVEAAEERFGGVDVLLNNAGYGHLGIFEESSEDEIRAQFETNVFGLMETTRAVLPAMRARGGTILNVSSTAGLRGLAGGALYCASKFAVEGFGESLALEVERFGIRVISVEPGPFRTDFLDPSSVRISRGTIPDYEELAREVRERYEGRNHRQEGDPDRLARAMLALVDSPDPPRHFPAGSSALSVVGARNLRASVEVDLWRAISEATDGNAFG